MLLAPLLWTPSAPQYHLVFTADQFLYPKWWLGLFGFLFVAVGLVLRRALARSRVDRVSHRFLGPLFVIVGAVLVLGGTCGPYSAHARLRDALRAGRYVTVEGVVTDYIPGDWGDHVPEQFTVWSDGVAHHYAYTRSEITGGFDRAAVHGGPMRPGLRVRIADVGGVIARLEVADSTTP